MPPLSDEVDWIEEKDDEENDEDGFDYKFVRWEGIRCLLIQAAWEKQNFHRAVGLVQQFLAAFRPDDWWAGEFANNVTDPRVGAYGGARTS